MDGCSRCNELAVEDLTRSRVEATFSLIELPVLLIPGGRDLGRATAPVLQGTRDPMGQNQEARTLRTNQNAAKSLDVMAAIGKFPHRCLATARRTLSRTGVKQAGRFKRLLGLRHDSSPQRPGRLTSHAKPLLAFKGRQGSGLAISGRTIAQMLQSCACSRACKASDTAHLVRALIHIKLVTMERETSEGRRPRSRRRRRNIRPFFGADHTGGCP